MEGILEKKLIKGVVEKLSGWVNVDMEGLVERKLNEIIELKKIKKEGKEDEERGIEIEIILKWKIGEKRIGIKREIEECGGKEERKFMVKKNEEIEEIEED